MKAFDLTRTDAMEVLQIRDPRVFRRDYAPFLESRARTAECRRQRMYCYDDLMKRRDELDPQGVAEAEVMPVKDMKAFLKQYR